MAKSLLHETVKDLHSLLQLTENTPTLHFETILRRTVSNVFTLLELTRPPHHLDIYTSVYESRLFIYYTQSSAPHAEINNQNIYLYLQGVAVEQSGQSVFDQLLHILAESHGSQRPPRLRQSFSVVISRFSDLVRFLLQLQADTENDLVDFLTRCFVYEHSYISRLNSQLHEKIASENDTQLMVLALDSFIRKTLSEPASDVDSIFTHDHPPSDSALTFECLDESFSRLYHVFLQLALSKSLDSFSLDAFSYVKVMVKFFKVTYEVDFFEHDFHEFQDLKLDRICDFYVGSETSEGFVPSKFRVLAKNIIKEMYETSRYYITAEPDTEGRIDLEATNEETEYPPKFLNDDLIDLASHLDDLVSVLADFGLGFDLQFSRTFQTFVRFVAQDFSEDALPEDLQFILAVNETVAIIINYKIQDSDVEGDLIRSIIYDLLEMQSRLLSDLPNLTLLMKAARENIKAEDILKRQVLREWNHKMISVHQLESIYTDKVEEKAERDLMKRKLSIWYNKTVRFEKVQLQAASYSVKKTMAKVLSRFWLQKIIFVSNATAQADMQSLKHVFKLWRKKYDHFLEKRKNVMDLTAIHLMRRVWSLWTTKYQDVVALHDISLDFFQEARKRKDYQVVGNTFGAFKKKFEKVQFTYTNHFDKEEYSRKLSKLESIEFQVKTGKYLRNWIQKFKNEKSLREITSRSQYHYKDKVLTMWMKKFKLRKLGRLLEKNTNKILLSTSLSLWKVITDDRAKADSFQAYALNQKVMRLWRLKLIEAKGRSKVDHNVMSAVFKKWKVQVLFTRRQRDTNSDLANEVIQEWNHKTNVIRSNGEIAVNVFNTNLLKQHLRQWYSRYRMVLELNSIADLNFQRKHLDKLAKLYNVLCANDQKADNFLAGQLPFSQRILLSAVISKWGESYLRMFNNHTQKAVCSFEERIRTPGTLSVFLNHWKCKKTYNDQKQRQLEYYCQHHLDTSATKRAIFTNWIELSRRRLNDTERSSEFYITLLSKRFLLIWYEKFVTKVDYLDDVGQHMIDQKDYLRLVEFLRKWNLRYIKNVRRNQQTREIFTEKWQKAHMRSIFEIWLHKMRGRSPDSMYDFTEADTTFGSNYSPLAKKNPKLPSGSSILDSQSYLSTPVKKQVKSPSTPFTRGKGPSPTRLQETNQRMKFDRMDAMITRYRLAKGASKNDILRPSTATKLSPPSRRPKVQIPERPPAPLFEGISRSTSPNATSSPSATPGPIEHTNPTSISDDSILNTAKKLHRIRPLVVPPDDDIEDFQYSSTSRLRERLTSQSAVAGQTNVFGIL